MALFQKKPQLTSSAPLYSLGSVRTVLIVGLGNPGKQYEGTRHNLGFTIVDDFAKRNDFTPWVAKKDLKCEIASGNIGETRVILCKPATFMNASGEAVAATQHFWRIYNQHTLVVYDELALAFGQLRTRLGGSDAGHNGVKSLIQYVGEDFGRLRVGIGSETTKKAEAADFVLGKFTAAEKEKLSLIVREADSLITEYIVESSFSHKTRSIS